MTASPPRPDASETGAARRAGAAIACALILALAGCVTPSAPPTRSPLEPLPALPILVPDAADRAARDAAEAALVGNRAALDRAISRLEEIEAERRAAGEPPTGLLPQALDARNATLEDARARREATAALLERKDVGPELRSRLREEVEDDPLRLAQQRLRDARVHRYGRVVNALAEPAGRSMLNTAMLPYRLGNSLLHLWLAERAEDALTPPERQALDHWKRFLDQHPDAPEAAELLGKVQGAQLRWLQTQRDRHLRESRRALRAGDAWLSAALTARALRYTPEDAEAAALLQEARTQADQTRERWSRSLGASADPRAVDPAQRPLAVTLLLDGADPAAAAEVLAADPDSGFHGEAAFAQAILALEERRESEAWSRLSELAQAGDAGSPMARHARAMLASPEQNPYRAFRNTRGQTTKKQLRWLAFGPLVDGPRERDLPRPVEYLVEVPTLVPVVMGLPNRVIRAPFVRAEWNVPSVLARRYLERFPQGEHEDEVREWLAGFERRRGNHVGALRIAEAAREPDARELSRLRERASEQALDASLRERRRDVRHQLLREVAREFQGTEAGQRAGGLAREELQTASPQRIRVSRGFLLENPRVAGPEGLALRPELLDGDPRNGELHPEGVTLLGGRLIELAFLAPSGRASHEPERVRRRISEERLARVVAQLEEAMVRTARVDRDARVDPDPDRDTFFERVRIGLADQPDFRPRAESTYTFTGMRERYGLVRSRESILPVEIVLQGSFDDFGLGAFPRIRMPKATPDAFLYR